MEPGFKSGPQTPLHTTLQVTVPFALALTPAISLSQWSPPGPRGWGVLCPWYLHCFPHLFPSAQQQKATEGGLLCHQVAFGSHLISFGWTFTTCTLLSCGCNLELHNGSLGLWPPLRYSQDFHTFLTKPTTAHLQNTMRLGVGGGEGR